MNNLSPTNLRQNNIIKILLEHRGSQSSEIHKELSRLGENISLVTVKRFLSELKSKNIISESGSSRNTSYTVTDYGKLTFEIDARSYCAIEPDKRYGQTIFNFGLFETLSFNPFTTDEMRVLSDATSVYHKRISGISDTLREKELERFVIELSWKSSKIEGNTYTLLDTEKLILRGEEAKGHDRNEARMILNHKDAFKFIRENQKDFKELNKSGLEEIHKILIHDLNVNKGFRSKPVGITGSIYKPLDNPHKISEAFLELSKAVSRMDNPYAKALITIMGISYIQPFEDGNKRTARLVANAILLAHDCAPLSYRSVDENEYRDATLSFYELNSLMPFKKIFIEQYIFSAQNYLVS